MGKKNKLPAGYIEVKHDRFYIRSSPNVYGYAIGKAKAGDKLAYLGKTEKGWNCVRFGNKTGWISKQAGAVTLVKQTYLTVNEGNWHIRAGNSSKSESLGVVTGGDRLLYQDVVSNNFYLVVYNNQNGWISTRAIVKEGT